MNLRNVAIFVSAALVLAALAWAFVWRVAGLPWETPGHASIPAVSGEERFSLGLDPAQITSLAIGGVEIARDAPARPWTVRWSDRGTPRSWPAIPGEIQAALRRLQTAVFLETDGGAPRDAIEIALAEPDGRLWTIRAASSSTAGRTLVEIARPGVEPVVATTSSEVIEGLTEAALVRWRERSIEAITGPTISEVSIGTREARVGLRPGPLGWSLTHAGSALRANGPLARGVVRALGGMSIDTLAEETGSAAIASYTLRAPDQSVTIEDLGPSGITAERRLVRVTLGDGASLTGEIAASAFPSIPTEPARYLDPRATPWPGTETGALVLGQITVRRGVGGWSTDADLTPDEVTRLGALAERLSEPLETGFAEQAVSGASLSIERIGGSDSTSHRIYLEADRQPARLVLQEGPVERILPLNSATAGLLARLLEP